MRGGVVKPFRAREAPRNRRPGAAKLDARRSSGAAKIENQAGVGGSGCVSLEERVPGGGAGTRSVGGEPNLSTCVCR